MIVGITAREDDLAASPLVETQITFAELNLRTQTDYRSSFSANSGSTSFGLAELDLCISRLNQPLWQDAPSP